MTSQPRLRRVGHKGADLIVPGNTHASFDAALDAGVDMIEFDVLPEKQGDRLLLAHAYVDAARRSPHPPDDGLQHLAAETSAGIELGPLRALEALGVTGVITNGPRLFAELITESSTGPR